MELITAQISRLSLNPADTLVVRCIGHHLTCDVARRVRKDIEQRTGHSRILVIGDDIELSVMERAAIGWDK